MVFRGWVPRGVALAASVLLLAGCSGGPATSPLSQADRVSIRTELLDARWQSVTDQYPEALRPRLSIAPTVPDHDWPAAVIVCLHRLGFVAVQSGGGVEYRNGRGKTPLEYAVALYTCEGSHPAESAVAARLGPRQSASLYGYYLNVVRPCLLLAGAPSPASPDRSAVESLAGLAGWNPYQVIWTSGVPASRLDYLERRCPPVPAWLDLGSG
ncbi:hypothetical protein [Lacisediminihabitans profunda]|nr:hypothetical protein [Lacisediminihabitans profunda]